MTPRLSSYWLYFVTSTSYKLATSLVDSMKVEVVASNNDILKILDIKPLTYKKSIKRAFMKIEKHAIVSSWKDSTVSGRLYWMSVFPFHSIIFNGLIRKLTKSNDVCSAMFPEQRRF